MPIRDENRGRARALPDQSDLLAAFRYDPETGLIYWKHGRRAFTTKMQSGYMQGRIAGILYLAHRVIWKINHDAEPPQIDHINGERADNRLCNLRAADSKVNGRNLTLRRDSKSGYAGVCFLPRTKRWRAYVQGRHIGYFHSLDSAKEARRAANLELGFSPRHGTPRP